MWKELHGQSVQQQMQKMTAKAWPQLEEQKPLKRGRATERGEEKHKHDKH